MLGRNRTFIKIFLVVHLERKWRKTIRRVVRACTEILANIQRSTFIMVAHGILHILYGDFAVCFQIKRHWLIGFTFYIRKKFFSTVGKHIEIAPYTGFTVATCTEIQRSVCICKTEILIHAGKVTFFAGKRNHIGRIKAIILVVHIELMDTGLVGMSRDAIIRDTYSYPYGTTHTRAFTYHFHNPDLIRIGNSERLTTAVIAVFLYKIGHHLNGFTGSTGTLQSQVNQTTVINNTSSIHQFRTTSKSSLGNGKLEFVDVTNNIVSLAGLLYPAQIFAGIPLMHIHQSAFLMYTGRIMI